MPHELLGPQPALLPHVEDKVEDIGMTLAVDDALLDVEHKRARRLQNAQKLLCLGQKPVDIFVRGDAAVGVAALIGVGGVR